MAFIDYHTHTNCSDGSDTPAELLNNAVNLGLEEIAITDHDTIKGLNNGILKNDKIKIIPGVELSADYNPGTMHIVGLNLDKDNKELNEKLDFLSIERKNRTPKIVSKLSDVNIEITEEEINEKANGGSVSRNHIAALLIEKGYVKTREEAFEKYLKKGAPAYMPKVRLKPEECVKVLKKSGAIVILAHPVQLKLDEEKKFRQELEELISYGIDGIETVSSHHDEKHTDFYSKIAMEYKLIRSAGSDYHGAVKPNVKLGVIADKIDF